MDKASANGISDGSENNRHSSRDLLQGADHCTTISQDDVGCEGYESGSMSLNIPHIGFCPAVVDTHIAADAPAVLLQALHKCGEAADRLRIVGSQGAKHPNMPYSLGLLCPHRK